VIVTGMERQGYDVSLTRYPEGWRATFIRRDHMTRPWVGQVLSFHLCTRVQRQLITAVLGVSHQGEYRR
jgi:hypothetical protein